MASLKKKILGSVSGALGDVVFRERKGNNIIAVRPASFKTPLDAQSVERRGKFTMATKLARAVYVSSDLKSLWQSAAPSGTSPFNYLVKQNYFSVNSASPGSSIKMVPAGGFTFTSSEAVQDSTGFSLTINALGTNNGIDTNVEVNLQVYSILFMGSPTDDNVAPFTFLTLSSDIKPLTLDNPVTFATPLISSQTVLYNQYSDYMTYFALVTLDSQGKVIHYSITDSI